MRFQGPLGIRPTASEETWRKGTCRCWLDEVVEMLAPLPGSLQIDATVGGGGHTERILEASRP